MDNNLIFKNNLKEIRTKKKLSQEDLAKNSGNNSSNDYFNWKEFV